MVTTKKRIKEMKVNIGISAENRETIANALSRVLADTYALYLKTHKYKWNVTGELFHPLQEQFKEQYTELAEAVNEITERIRVLGFQPLGTYKEFKRLTSIEEDAEQPKYMEMVRRLVVGNEQVFRTVREALKPAQRGEDEATIDLLTQRLSVHSKTAWMLRSHLE